MVNMSDLSRQHGSEASAKRLKKRKAAQWRLQAYGILAITLAGAALLALLWSIAGKASGAFTESYITLPVALEQSKIDPDNTGDPAVIGKANWGGIVKDALKLVFPRVKDRKLKRQLYDLVSGGAAFELGADVIANPELVGQTVDFRFLASDISDLYLKGSYGRMQPLLHTGALTVTTDGKGFDLVSSADDFAGVMQQVRDDLLAKAAHDRVQAALQENGRRVFTERAAAATDPTEKTAAIDEAAVREAARDKLLAQAVDYENRATASGDREELDADSPSILLRVNNVWVKLSEVSPTGGKGTALGDLAEGTYAPDGWETQVYETPEAERKVSDLQAMLLESLKAENRVDTVFNTRFFTAGDSREPELAGIWGAAVGSFWTMLVTILLAFPIGVAAAIYLEEFAKKTAINRFIEVNINNLAAVPSIVFGLLGLAVFLNFFGVPRSAPLAGGLVLAVMTLPTIIISARASIAAVPPSIRDAALGIGASKLQTAFHHVLPLSMPGILTGTIIGMARALGETAPLIMIGMVAFIVDIPTGVTDSATVLPVQIYRWSDFPERAFEARTSAAILTLIVFLILMNGLAVFLRKRFERRW